MPGLRTTPQGLSGVADPRGTFRLVPATAGTRQWTPHDPPRRPGEATLHCARDPRARGRSYVVTDGTPYGTRRIYQLILDAVGRQPPAGTCLSASGGWPRSAAMRSGGCGVGAFCSTPRSWRNSSARRATTAGRFTGSSDSSRGEPCAMPYRRSSLAQGPDARSTRPKKTGRGVTSAAPGWSECS